jgi:hypothetical protein
MSEVQSNKSKVDAGSERAKANNTFFDVYNSFLLPTLTAYTIVKQNTDYTFPQEAVNKLKECLDYVTKTLDSKQVLNVSTFRVNSVYARDKISEAWIAHVNEITRGILDDLGVFKLVSDNKLEIVRLSTAIKGNSTWPVTKKQFDDCTLALEVARNLLKTMKFDSEIETFLRKVRDKQATLQDLSDPIIKWIRDNNFEGSIQLSIKT